MQKVKIFRYGSALCAGFACRKATLFDSSLTLKPKCGLTQVENMQAEAFTFATAKRAYRPQQRSLAIEDYFSAVGNSVFGGPYLPECGELSSEALQNLTVPFHQQCVVKEGVARVLFYPNAVRGSGKSIELIRIIFASQCIWVGPEQWGLLLDTQSDHERTGVLITEIFLAPEKWCKLVRQRPGQRYAAIKRGGGVKAGEIMRLPDGTLFLVEVYGGIPADALSKLVFEVIREGTIQLNDESLYLDRVPYPAPSPAPQSRIRLKKRWWT